MPTLTQPAPTPPSAAPDAADAQARIAAAEQAIERLHQEAAELNSAFDSAVEAGDRAGLATARTRHAEIADDLLIEQRAILVAHVSLAQDLFLKAQARMRAAYAAAEVARQAEVTAFESAKERRRAEVENRRLLASRYEEVVREDTGDERRERDRLTTEAGGLRNLVMELERAVQAAQRELEAHRRHHWLHLAEQL